MIEAKEVTGDRQIETIHEGQPHEELNGTHQLPVSLFAKYHRFNAWRSCSAEKERVGFVLSCDAIGKQRGKIAHKRNEERQRLVARRLAASALRLTCILTGPKETLRSFSSADSAECTRPT